MKPVILGFIERLIYLFSSNEPYVAKDDRNYFEQSQYHVFSHYIIKFLEEKAVISR